VAEQVDPRLTVRLQLLGRDITTVKSYTITSSYMTSTDGWEVMLYDTRRENLRGLEMQPVELLINDCSQVLGRVEVTDIGGDGSAVTVRGRDFIADLVECSVDPSVKIKAGVTVADAITLAAGPVGIDTVVSDDDIAMRDIRSGKEVTKPGKALKKFLDGKLDEYKPQPGEGVFAFCDRIAARQGVTIQPGNTRHTIVLARPRYDQAALYKIRRLAGDDASPNNNIVSAQATRDYTSFPTFCFFTGKTGRAGKSKTGTDISFTTAALTAEIGGELAETLDLFAFKNRIKPNEGNPSARGSLLYRLLYSRDEQSRNQDQLERAALRGIAERLKETLRYEVTLRGHADPETGANWAIDTIVHVIDEVCGIDEPLWIEERVFSYSEGSGATTKIVCWRPGSFQI